MVIKNTRNDLLGLPKEFARKDTSYSSFWLYNRENDLNSEHLRDRFVNFYDEKILLSEFNPTIAKNIISYWSNEGDLILDPFSGRTRALVSYSMNRKYLGYEISKDAYNYTINKFKDLKLSERENFNVDIKNEDCINMESLKDESVDLIFTCPPYWDIEKYESCKGQLSDIEDYDIFLKELMLRLNISIKKLKKDKYMCIVIGDFRKNKKYYALHSFLIQSMENNKDIKLHDIIAVQNIPFNTAAFYFGPGKKSAKITSKAHEYLLVWKKL
jgi:DNA modification methylase